MSIPFYKLEGTGNDFIFFNEKDFPFPDFNRQTFVKKLCSRNFGIGADGMVFTRNWKMDKDRTSFSWDFYNSDGSPATMCGNAARCAVVYNSVINGSQNCEFLTAIGTLQGSFVDSDPQVNFELQSDDPHKQQISAAGANFEGYFYDSGVPHFVIPVKDLNTLNHETCRLIQTDPSFGNQEVNITLLKVDAPSETKTFERGVRDFTLSCGTGVIACAKVIQILQGVNRSQLQTPGGKLSVELKNTTVSLKGPAFCVFKGEIDSKVVGSKK